MTQSLLNGLATETDALPSILWAEGYHGEQKPFCDRASLASILRLAAYQAFDLGDERLGTRLNEAAEQVGGSETVKQIRIL